jgi:riboflavin kinase/FMN adenylyltransferase
VVGYHYAFGYKREGGIKLLQEMGDAIGFKVHVIEPIHLNSTLVSSTSVRKFIKDGDLQEAKRLLGRDYQIIGTVISGKDRGGRLLGFPTANLKLVDELIPKRGVYAVTVEVDGVTYYGVSNIGYNPTFGDTVLSLETHILDFSGDLLGKTIGINFTEYLRDEKTFRSVQELSDQIAKDIQRARELFRLHTEE